MTIASITRSDPDDASGAEPGALPLLVLYDGVCHLCQGVVRFIVDRDPSAQFSFAPLQSVAARRSAPAALVAGRPSVLLVERGVVYSGSTAALRIARRLGFPWKLCYGLIVVPPAIRDVVYGWIARRRYRWFGRSDVCERPAPEVMARMAVGAFDDLDPR